MFARTLSVFSMLFLFGFGTVLSGLAQNRKIDSLKSLLENAREDSNYVKTLFRLGMAFAKEKNYTAAMPYVTRAHELAVKKKLTRLSFTTLSTKCQIFYIQAMPDSALKYLEKLKKAALKAQNYEQAYWACMMSSDVYSNKSDYANAMEAAMEALRIAEKNRDNSGMAGAHKAMGVAQAYLSDYVTAVKEYNIARDIYLSIGDTAHADGLFFVLGIAHGQIHGRGLLLDKQKQYQLAIDYLVKGRNLCVKANEEQGIHLYNNEIAGFYSGNGEFEKALEYSLSSYYYFKKNNQKEATANSCVKIVTYLGNLKKYKEQLFYIKELYGLSVETQNPAQQLSAAAAFADYYEAIKEYQAACDFHHRAGRLRDSIFDNKYTGQVAEMAKKYETEKKDKELVRQEAEIKVQQADAGKKSTQRNFFIVGFGLMFLSTFLVLKGYNQKKKANIIISEQKKEVENQKHIVDEKQKEILDSIHYAKRIQSTLMTSKEFISNNVRESFVFFKPKDIVSGDFFWATNLVPDMGSDREFFYIAVCDSTGHGVPGAFMSLLNSGFISEAIKEKDISHPNKIFNYVRKRLVESISKEGQKDGFDGIILCIDKSNNKITYAAANNKPVLISDGQLKVLSCDKMPVGYGEKNDLFQLYTIEAKKGDVIYLYTDGFADQFGGPKGKKFKYKQLDDLLISGSGLSLEEQSAMLEQKFMEWKGNLEQVDDVCIIGVKL